MALTTTCLWFHSNGHEAAEFYITLFPNSEITHVFRHRQGPPLTTDFTLDGAPYQALNGGPAFTLDASASIIVGAEDQADIDRLWDALCADGDAPGRCGWLTDRFGLSWQIIPKRWFEIRLSADKTGMRRAFHAMMDMDKIDMSRIEAAFYGRD